MALTSCLVESVMQKVGWMAYFVMTHSLSLSLVSLLPSFSQAGRRWQPLTWQPFPPVGAQQSTAERQAKAVTVVPMSGDREWW